MSSGRSLVNNFGRFLIGSHDSYSNILGKMKGIYVSKLLPLEERYLFHDFHVPPLDEQYFHAKPMVILIGQYSTGKTTLLRYILSSDFPGLRIGPEPTTDKFMILMKGDKNGIIPGNALVADQSKHFKPLSKFGINFLNKVQCSLVDSPVLDSMTFIDTPGILSGEKQRVDRGYEFEGVLEWFSEHVDRILLLFDANKLDISDEFQRSIEAIKGHDEKIRIILNKADVIDHQSLLRVYGALMWSLGKVLKTPEVARVYVGSFWDNALHNDTNRRLFAEEERDLFDDLQSLPKNNVVRKVNDLNKRARLAIVHALIIGTLHKNMPLFFGRSQRKNTLVGDLERIYKEIEDQYGISPGDFPDICKMQVNLNRSDFNTFRPIDMTMIERVEHMMSNDIADIMRIIPSEDVPCDVGGGVFANRTDVGLSPFEGSEEGVNEGRGEPGWIVTKKCPNYVEQFEALAPVEGKVRSGAKKVLEESRLPSSTLSKIWNLSDVDRDGRLDVEEFGLALYLSQLKCAGKDLPESLPHHLVPPSKRK